MTPIQVFTTGGTIDKHYPVTAGSRDLVLGKPAAPTIIRRLGPPYKIQFKKLLSKDSLDIAEGERMSISTACASAIARRIVITHGTDSMVETAAVIASANLQKTVVLTGARSPACMKDSDADFNLGFAVAAAQILPFGVYIAMNGCVFAAGQCRKNPTTGVFESNDRR